LATLHRDFDLAHIVATDFVLDGGQVFTNGILNILQGLLFRGALGSTSR
jgi:hypothetical protein